MKTIPTKPERLNNISRAIQIFYRIVNRGPYIPSRSKYNITISHESKFIWFRVAKSGTRTILNHLRASGICLDVEHASGLHYPPKIYADYYKFAFVRNPWDRLVSCWHNKVVDSNLFRFSVSDHEKMLTFENFVEYVAGLNIEKCNRHVRSQSALIDLNNINYLGRIETFQEDLNFIFQRLGIDETELVSKNVTSDRKPYQEYYSLDLVERVRQIYRKDIQLFGYKY